jgi:hypothetical protein
MGMDDLENEYNFNRQEESDEGDQALAPGGFHGSMVTKDMLAQSRKEIANDINPDHKNDINTKSMKPKGLSLDIEENSDYES